MISMAMFSRRAVRHEIDPPTAVETAAAHYFEASETARDAERIKRSTRKILDRAPVGRYGQWLIERVPSGRQTADLELIGKIFASHGLGPVPMKDTAPSLRVTREVRG